MGDAHQRDDQAGDQADRHDAEGKLHAHHGRRQQIGQVLERAAEIEQRSDPVQHFPSSVPLAGSGSGRLRLAMNATRE